MPVSRDRFQNMAYINCCHGNYYKPGENLGRLFKDLVVHPFEEHPSSQPWIGHVVNTDHTYHREEILKRGRANFSKPDKGLSPEDMVLLYCVYYLPMHLFSSYRVFSKGLAPISDKIVFIDFGCGPLTAGIAFWAFAQQHDITYLGIDSSEAMRHKASEINRYGPNSSYRNAFFSDGRLISEYNRLPEVLKKYKYIERDSKSHIIFNFSYFLASETLVVKDLFDVLIQIMEQYGHHKMWIIYQNPPIPQGLVLRSSFLHQNWHFLKTRLSMFHSQITHSNTEPFRYDRLTDRSLANYEVYFDILSNESSAISTDPFEFHYIF